MRRKVSLDIDFFLSNNGFSLMNLFIALKGASKTGRSVVFCV